MKDSYNIKYLLNYTNLLHELNKHITSDTKELQFIILDKDIESTRSKAFKLDVCIDCFTFEKGYNDTTDVLNFLKETMYYNDDVTLDDVRVEVY